MFCRLIQLSSPNLNYLIGIGAIVLYADIYFFVIPSTDKVTVTVFCNVREFKIHMHTSRHMHTVICLAGNLSTIFVYSS